MTIEERLEAIAQNLDTLTRIHLDDDREYRERFNQLTETQQKNARDIEANARDIQSLKTLLQMDAENIRALARIAELHEQRLDRLEGE